MIVQKKAINCPGEKTEFKCFDGVKYQFLQDQNEPCVYLIYKIYAVNLNSR